MALGFKDGEQVCPRCKGEKCWHCRRTGTVVQCPVCANAEHELINKDGNIYSCMACESSFSSSGERISADSQENH